MASALVEAVANTIDVIGVADGFKPRKHPVVTFLIHAAVFAIDMLDVVSDVLLFITMLEIKDCFMCYSTISSSAYGGDVETCPGGLYTLPTFMGYCLFSSHLICGAVLNVRVIQKAPLWMVQPAVVLDGTAWSILLRVLTFPIQVVLVFLVAILGGFGALIVHWVDLVLHLVTFGRFKQGKLYYLPVDEMDSISSMIILFFEDIPQMAFQVYIYAVLKIDLPQNSWDYLNDKGTADCQGYFDGTTQISDSSQFSIIFALTMTSVHIVLSFVILWRRSKALNMSLISYTTFLFGNRNAGLMVQAYTNQIREGTFNGNLLNFSNGASTISSCLFKNGNGISEEECRNLCQILIEQPKKGYYAEGDNLKSLYLVDCNIDDCSLEHIIEYMSSDGCELEILDLSKNWYLTADSYLRLGEALSTNKSIKYIILWREMHPKEFDDIKEEHGKRIVDTEQRYAYMNKQWKQERQNLRCMIREEAETERRTAEIERRTALTKAFNDRQK